MGTEEESLDLRRIRPPMERRVKPEMEKRGRRLDFGVF